MMDLFNNINGVQLASMHMLLLLLSFRFSPEEIQEDIESIMNEFSGIVDQKNIRRNIEWIVDDKISEEIINNPRNRKYAFKLLEVKNEFTAFYNSLINEVNNKAEYKDINKVCDMIARYDSYKLHISRLRMLINPKIQITINVHKITRITYLTLKGFWLNDDAKEVRIHSSSMGRSEQYKNGKEDEQARIDGIVRFQQKLIEQYEKLYGK
jgi:hypothetical protein